MLELQDNRIEHLSSPLPRTLARFNIRRNALQRVAFPPLVTKPDTLASIEIAHNPGIEEVRDTENRTYQHLVRNAQRDFHPTPTRPSSAIPEWVRTSLWERPPMNARNDNEFSEGGDRAWNGSVINPTNRRVTVPTSRRVTEPMLNRPMGGGPVHTPPADNIYTNTQSVHDAGIQDSARQNLSYIHMYSPETPVQSMAAILASIQTYVSLTYYNRMSTWERILSTITFHFGSNTASVVNEVRTRTQGIGNDYVIHGYTPSAIVERLWTRILAERSPDLIMRFSEEVLSARNMCTNGFMTRMANVLVGFDPAVVMRVTPEKVLQQRVPATLARLRKATAVSEGEEPWTFWLAATLQTWSDMEEVELPVSDRRSWLEPLVAGMLDNLVMGLKRNERIGKYRRGTGCVQGGFRSSGGAHPGTGTCYNKHNRETTRIVYV